jgi:hypothetical protein
MVDEIPITTTVMKLTDAQLDDFAKLLAKSVSPGNILWLATSVVGRPIEQKVGDDVEKPDRSARRILQIIQDEGKIADAIRVLREQAHTNAWLMVGLKQLLDGEDLSDDNLQALVNELEPFLSSKALQEYLPRVLRTICAVAVGPPTNSIVGSGFLIAPDLVMTNFHVLETLLDVDPATHKVSAKPTASGKQIFFFFDYLAAPAPNVPPEAGLAVTAADDWLVYGRKSLFGDGTSKQAAVTKEYDYVVVRLTRRVGDLSARKGGGNKRGWLQLPKEGIEVLPSKRIIVFQHPQKAPQQWDIGDYVKMDQSATRVWYSVSTAHGSSGGAAVDKDGRLFALHNAEVLVTDAALAGRKLNQGIRIDKIIEDLAAEAPSVLEVPPDLDDSQLFWSFTDDPKNSTPIIGRTKFREMVADMLAPNAERVLVVTGPPNSGRRFSIDLLRHTVGLRPVVVFSPADVGEMEPQQFLDTLVSDLKVLGLGGNKPEALATESESRWVPDLGLWLRDRLAEDEKRNPTKYPGWVVINMVVAPGARLSWARNLTDCVAALCGAHDPGQAQIDIPQLRWLFLASSSTVLPVSGVKQLEEDLDNYNMFEQDFADCLALARSAIDKQAPEQDEVTLKGMARVIQMLNADTLPLRKALANSVREIISKA